ncbi:MAG: hypothetical protein IJX04_02720 [Oscillospiraceae bacterium]|nr:hypothetical protein [Oscillospiraceae bacterium]
MKLKCLGLKVMAFACAAVYLVIMANSISEMMAATSRNFLFLNVLSSLLGAVLFLVYGVIVHEKTLPKYSAMVGLGNMVTSLLPFALLALLMSPRILLALPPEVWKAYLLPMLLSLFPFAVGASAMSE